MWAPFPEVLPLTRRARDVRVQVEDEDAANERRERDAARGAAALKASMARRTSSARAALWHRRRATARNAD
jgi:hypothetical protein